MNAKKISARVYCEVYDTARNALSNRIVTEFTVRECGRLYWRLQFPFLRSLHQRFRNRWTN